MATNTIESIMAEDGAGKAAGVFEMLSQYGSLFVSGLYLVVVGCLIVFLLNRIAARLIYKRMKNRRLIRVIFGFLYLLVISITVLMAMERMGLKVEVISRVIFLVLILGSVSAYFLAPFFPRLPFTLGHLVEVNGVLGTVDAISQIHTMIRKFDGTMVFIPNPVVLSSKILNFNATPHRRIEMAVSINNDSDIGETMDRLVLLMQADERVLEEPAPPSVIVVAATAAGVDLMLYCWVNNADWLKARSDLWLQIVDAFENDQRLQLSLPQQEVFVLQKDEPAP